MTPKIETVEDWRRVERGAKALIKEGVRAIDAEVDSFFSGSAKVGATAELIITHCRAIQESERDLETAHLAIKLLTRVTVSGPSGPVDVTNHGEVAP